MNVIARFLLNVLGLLVLAELFSGISVSGLYVAVITVIILAILNAIVRPVLFILTLPITIVTLGLFAFVINALILLFAASFIDGFAVDGFISALIGSLVMSIVGTIGSTWIK